MTGHTPIFLPDGRCVGRIVNDEYHTPRRRSVHMLQKPPAWAIDRDILAQLEARGVERVVIRERESGGRYSAALRDFTRHGIRIDRGYGAQIALPLAYWRKDGAPSDYERQAEREALRTAQLQMFGAGGAA